MVEVWDGNMKDVQKLKGSLLQLAAEADRQPHSSRTAAAGAQEEDDEAEDEAAEDDEAEDDEAHREQEVAHELLAADPSVFEGGMHAYEVFLLPFCVVLVAGVSFGRSSSFLAPVYRLHRHPRAYTHSNRAQQQNALQCRPARPSPEAKLVQDELQPAWHAFIWSDNNAPSTSPADLLSVDKSELEGYRMRFTAVLRELSDGQRADGAMLSGKVNVGRVIARLMKLQIPQLRRFFTHMHERFSTDPSICHKTEQLAGRDGGELLATCGCGAAITTAREQLPKRESVLRVLHGALDGRLVRPLVLVHDNGCGLAACAGTNHTELREAMPNGGGRAVDVATLLHRRRGARASTESESRWKQLHRKAWRVLPTDYDRRVLTLMATPGLLKEHPLVGLNILLVLIDRFHQAGHTSLMCEAHAMRHLPELRWVVSQNVEHRWRQKSHSLSFLRQLAPGAHAVVQAVLDAAWCRKSFDAQMRAARLRLPQGCDLAYNVFQQVQARCTACGHYYGQCRHTAAPCAHASAVAEDEDAVATVAREHGLAELVRRHSERCQCPEPTPEGDIAALLDPPAPLDLDPPTPHDHAAAFRPHASRGHGRGGSSQGGAGQQTTPT